MKKEYKLAVVLLLLFAFGAVLSWAQGKPINQDPADIATPTPTGKSSNSDPETLPVEIITPTHQVLPIFKMGDELKIEEEQKWDGVVVIRTDETPQSYPYSKVISQQYTEKIALITTDQLSFKSERAYLSSVIKSNMPDDGKKTMTTSLEGKTLALESKNYQIISYEKTAPKEAVIISDDYTYVNSLNWFYTCLPGVENAVAIGSSYPIKSNELARVIFKEYYNEKSCVVIGNGVLEEVIKSRKTLSSRILINVKIKQKTKDTESSVELIGFCKLVAGGDNPSLELEIAGPFTITKPSVTHDEKKILSSASGNLKIKSRVTLKK
ncbi:MAG: hypothetical protein HZA49_02280 [Planctomycetes bacterium]|nr:hypothetical protein [Planctomycetota bacterium]